MSFDSALREGAAACEALLLARIDALPESAVRDGMRHAVHGGKGLRGFLAVEGARLHGIAPGMAAFAGAAIEAMHASSLVHDDLPAMDDDALRRGQPTVHVKWDEATAILVGDALQVLAFEFLADPRAAPTDAARVALSGALARAAGARGMVLGQALDLAAERASVPLTLDAVIALQAGKTGALIEWAACAGPRIAGDDPGALAAYARALGLAFQVADDILDVVGDAAKAGKKLQKDAAAGKATFVSLLGLDGARARARALVADAQDALAPYGADADILRNAASFVIARDR